MRSSLQSTLTHAMPYATNDGYLVQRLPRPHFIRETVLIQVVAHYAERAIGQ